MEKINKNQYLKNVEKFLNKYDLDKLNIETFPNFIKNFKYGEIELLSSIFEINNVSKWDFKSYFDKKLDVIFKQWILSINKNIICEKQGSCSYELKFENEKMLDINLVSKNIYIKYKDIDITIFDKESLLNKHKKELDKIESYKKNPNLMWILFDNTSVLRQKIHTFKRKIFYILEKKRYMEIFEKKTKTLIENNKKLEIELKQLKDYKSSLEYKNFIEIYQETINLFKQLDFVIY